MDDRISSGLVTLKFSIRDCDSEFVRIGDHVLSSAQPRHSSARIGPYWRRSLSELGNPSWATDELKKIFITVYRTRLSKEDRQFINDKYGHIKCERCVALTRPCDIQENALTCVQCGTYGKCSRVNLVKRYNIMDNMLLENEQYDWLLAWYKIYKCINMRRPTNIDAKVNTEHVADTTLIKKYFFNQVDFTSNSRRKLNENIVRDINDDTGFVDVPSVELMPVNYDIHQNSSFASIIRGFEKYRPENDSRDIQRTEMLSTANHRSISNTLSGESARNGYAFSNGNPHARIVLHRDSITSEGENASEVNFRSDAVNQYTFEEYLDELSTMLEDVLYDENSVPQVEPIFYPNVDDTSGYNDSSNTAKGTEELSHRYTMQELMDEYDRVVESTNIFTATTAITEPSVLQIQHVVRVGECTAEDAHNSNTGTNSATATSAMRSIGCYSDDDHRDVQLQRRLLPNINQCPQRVLQDRLYRQNSVYDPVPIRAMAPQLVVPVQADCEPLVEYTVKEVEHVEYDLEFVRQNVDRVRSWY
ncbi:MAG: hypothetical protein NXY57DRAFT_959932 [Lentinula lateritia]|nr:MAG: hypothetical protein NXY57DRAFT_959932 [Lentinula lateritia]